MDAESFMRMMELDGVPVAVVDPADLLAVWKLQRGTSPSTGGGQMALGMSLYQSVCSPGADIQAVWYRATMLQLLAGPMQSLAPWMHDGQLDPAAFRVMAAFPLKKMGIGVRHQGLPFDVEEILKEIAKAAGDSGAEP